LKVVLSQFDCNLIVFGYGAMPRNEADQFKKLCDSTNEGKFLMSPNDEQIRELFTSLANYRFERNKHMILETFN
jgi:hypothetical protein